MIIDRRFRDAYCLHHQGWVSLARKDQGLYRCPFVLGSQIPDDGGSTHLWNVGRQSFYTAVYPRRQLLNIILAAVRTWNLTSWYSFIREEMERLLWNTKGHYCFRSILILSSPIRTGLTSGLFPSGFLHLTKEPFVTRTWEIVNVAIKTVWRYKIFNLAQSIRNKR
jgi:hypothetical protein